MSQEEQIRPPDPSWRQGSLIGYKLIAPIADTLGLREAIPEDALIVLISQDCDIVHDSYEAEPFIEFLVATRRPPADENKGLEFGKHPRRLQFKLIRDEGAELLEINVQDKYRVRREILLGGVAEGKLDTRLTEVIARWIAKRYTRAAFPDEFNERCRAAREKLSDLFKKQGDLITGVYIRLEPEDVELPKGHEYRVLLFATCTRDIWEDYKRKLLAIELVERIREKLSECEGVLVDEATLVPEHRFSLEDICNTDRWDYDYLTYRSGSTEAADPAG